MEKDALDHFIGDKASQQHIDHCMNNDFYTENTNTCQSMLGRHRVLPYHWKGMDQGQKKTILQEQERMIEDRKRREQMEKEEEMLWDLQQEEIRRMKVKMDRQKNRGTGTKMNEIVEFNKLKAKEDKMRADEMYCRTHDYKVF